MTNITILVFGQLVEVIGKPRIVMNDVMDTDALVAALNKLYPALTNSKYVMAVDKEVVSGNTSLQPNATVAFLPPFSGG